MALFKILRGPSDSFETTLSATVSPAFKDGYCYFLTDTNMFYVDYIDNGIQYRVPLNAQNANTITAHDIDENGQLVAYNEKYVVANRVVADKNEIPTSQAVSLACNILDDKKMDKENPTGTGAMSINRKNGTTVGANSVAMGSNPTASGEGSVALGYNTTASALGSVAIGHGATANRNYSVATGYNTTASGQSAHAEGHSTIASGSYSHATNLGTKATASSQTAIGKYNATNSDALFIIGNGTGTSDSARSNAFMVDKLGHVWASSLDPTDDHHLITKDYLKRNSSFPVHTAITCTEGQASFSLVNFNISQAVLPRRGFLVYFNGLLLVEGQHYSVDEASAMINLTGWAATQGDLFQIVNFLPNEYAL